jgi:hypothetical protein
MLTLGPGYARLDISADDEFSGVSESIRSLLHVCRLNDLDAALIVSRQDASDWRSSLRIGIRFATSRAPLSRLRLALVADHYNDDAQRDVLAVAREASLECRIFRSEAEAIDWLATGGGAASASAVQQR